MDRTIRYHVMSLQQMVGSRIMKLQKIGREERCEDNGALSKIGGEGS